MDNERRDAVIMGGSLGGLTAALYLREAGFRVTVLERSRQPLAGQGAGIVLNPATVRYFTERGTFGSLEMSVGTRWVRYVDGAGHIVAQSDEPYRFSSYNALYRGLRDAFGSDGYYLNEKVTGFEEEEDCVTVRTARGRRENCRLLVCADGVRSSARRWLVGDTPLEYAGYFAWRGILREEEVTAETLETLENAIVYHIRSHSHLLAYPILVVDKAGEAPRPFINWLWYRNVPAGPLLKDLMTDRDGRRRKVSLGPGTVQEQHIAGLRQEAIEVLPPQFKELILNTKEPFIQVVMDCEVEKMASRRVCLLGDAAFAVRPHAAAGTAKAAEDGYQLGRALQEHEEIPQALRAWETRQLKLGRSLLQRNRQAGRKLQNGEWPVGAHLAFGLYHVGDSEME